MTPEAAVALAATANTKEQGLAAALTALLLDLAERELITDAKRDAWLALAGIKPPAPSAPGQGKA